MVKRAGQCEFEKGGKCTAQGYIRAMLNIDADKRKATTKSGTTDSSGQLSDEARRRYQAALWDMPTEAEANLRDPSPYPELLCGSRRAHTADARTEIEQSCNKYTPKTN